MARNNVVEALVMQTLEKLALNCEEQSTCHHAQVVASTACSCHLRLHDYIV